MFGMKSRKGLRHEDARERLRQLGLKARRDPKSLTIAELGEICDLTAALWREKK